MKTQSTILSFSLVILALMVSSCLPDPLEISTVPKIKPEIVVSSQILSDQSLIVLLTKSFGALDASNDSDPQALLNQIAIDDATVTISSANGTDTLALVETGTYSGLTQPLIAGQQYTLRVDSRSMGVVTAITDVKPQVLFDEIEASLFLNGFGDSLAQVSYRFQDVVGKNFYMLNVQRVRLNNLQSQLLNPRSFIRLLNEEITDGQPYSETFKVFPTDFSEGDTIAVYLSNISESYFQFIRLRQDNRFSFVEFLGEPINYPTNVVGGKGFFNLYLPDVRLFVLSTE